MNKFLLMARLRLDERFGFSRVRYSTDAAQRRAPLILAGTKLAFYAVLFAAMTWLCCSAARAGYGAALPSMAYLAACVLSFLLTMLAMNDALNGGADSEFLLSTPTPEGVHAAILLLRLYFHSLPGVLLLCVPATIGYAQVMPAGPGFWLRWVFGLLLTEIPFGGIAAIAGMFITLCLAESPKKNQIQTGISIFCLVLGTALVLLLLNVSLAMINRTGAVGEEAARGITNLLIKNFLFTRFYQYAVVEQQGLYMFLFVVMSVLWYGVFAGFICMGYRVMVISLRCPVLYKEYHWCAQTQRPVAKALFTQNLRRLTGSRSYFTHMMTGIVPALLLPADLCIFGMARVLQAFGDSLQTADMQKLAPVLVCLFLGIANTAYCSSSMEGKYCWVAAAAPVLPETLRAARVMAHLVLMLPAAILSGSLFALALNSSVLGWLCLLLVPAIWCAVLCFAGVRIDERFADTSDESEELKLHRGLSYVLGYLPGVILPALALGLMLLKI